LQSQYFKIIEYSQLCSRECSCATHHQ